MGNKWFTGQSGEYAYSLSGFQKFLRFWLPALVYMTIIFLLSSIPNVSIPRKIHNIDKVLHFFEYFFLGLILGRGIISSFQSMNSFAACSMAVGLGTLTGVADELFQKTIPGRIPSIYDLSADFFGLLVGQIALLVLRKMRRERGT